MFELIETSGLAEWIRSSLWGWPVILSLHSLGTALSLGLIFIVLLRLLGRLRALRFGSLVYFFPAIWAALLVQALTGALLWLTKPLEHTSDGAFELKVLFLAFGLYLLRGLQKSVRIEAAAWDSAGKAPERTVKLAAAALGLWSAVLIAGRLTAQLGFIAGG